MINNRQGGGRRRGRGGQRPQGMGGQPGNRQDNRQRGNAAQLLEKYKSMARDAQLAGDRVQTEYFLQFADHYFRVLSESRARFEEQRPRSRDDDDADDGDEEMLETADDQGEQQQRRGRDYDDRPRRNPRERGDRDDRGDRPRRYSRDDRDERDEDERPARGNRSNGADRSEEPDDERVAFDFLPPAIGSIDEGAAPEIEAEEAPRPKRRVTRKPKADGGVAPAA